MGFVRLEAAFAGIRSVLLDTGPTIYALEKNIDWGERSQRCLDHLFDNGIRIVATPIILAECIAGAPDGDIEMYVRFLTLSREIDFVTLDA